MPTSHSMETTMTRKIVCMAVLLVAATVAACGGSTQSVAGTAPSQVTPLAVGSEGAGAFSPLKEGKGKGGHSDVGTTPTTGTTPEADDADEDSDGDENGKEHGHGNAMIQIEGFTASIDGSCPGLTIVMENTVSVRTVATPELTTEFQRATCKAIED